MANPVGRSGGSSGGSFTFDRIMLIGLSLLSVILIALLISTSGRLGRLAKELSGTQSKLRDIEDQSTRFDTLNTRIVKLEESVRLATSTSGTAVSAISRIYDDINALSALQKSAPSNSDFTELRTSISLLKDQVAAVKTQLETAAQPAQPAVAAADTAPKDNPAVTARLDTLDKRVAELASKPTSSSSQPKLDENAVRAEVDRIVKDEMQSAVQKAVQAQFDEFRNNRRPPR